MDTQKNTCQKTPIWFNSNEKEIPAMALAYFRARLSNKIHSLVLSEFISQENQGVISKTSLARRVGKKPEQITRWLGSSGNWTLETLSDLLLGMGLEPSISLRKINEVYSTYTTSQNISNNKIDMAVPDNKESNETQWLKVIKINNEFNASKLHTKKTYVITAPRFPHQELSLGKDSYKVLEVKNEAIKPTYGI